jgi:hypothetical protein
VPKRSDPGDKSFNWLIYRLIKRSRVGRRTDADLAGVRGVLGLGQRGWVESVVNGNACTAARVPGEDLLSSAPLGSGIIRRHGRRPAARKYNVVRPLAALIGQWCGVVSERREGCHRHPPLRRVSRHGVAARHQGCPPPSGAPRSGVWRGRRPGDAGLGVTGDTKKSGGPKTSAGTARALARTGPSLRNRGCTRASCSWADNR